MPIFDQGYQHWQGPLTGHGWRWLTIALQGTRVQLKSRNLRGLMIVALLPALALVIFMALWGLVEKKTDGIVALLQNFLPHDIVNNPSDYRAAVWTMAYSYFFQYEMFFIMALVAVAGPGLISSDLRFNALPLYFSRPLNRLDYFVGKLGVIGTLVASVAVGPAVLAYVVGLCFSYDSAVIKDTWKVVPASVACGLVITLSAGMLVLALSSLTRRSLYVGVAWAGLWIISFSAGAALSAFHYQSLRREIFQAETQLWVIENEDAPRPGPPRPGRQMPAARPEANVNDPRLPPLREAVRKAKEAQTEALGKDWRPLFSYVGNLNRVSDWLLGTEAARASFEKALLRSRQMAELAYGPRPPEGGSNDEPPPTYPWEWSGGVLAGLLGLSTWTLTSRVKSLDRLK